MTCERILKGQEKSLINDDGQETQCDRQLCSQIEFKNVLAHEYLNCKEIKMILDTID